MLMPRLLQFLQKHDADIVMLQEVYDGTASHLPERFRSLQALRQLPYAHRSFFADFLENNREGEKYRRGNAILSKFPIVKEEAIFFNHQYREDYIHIPENALECPRHIQYAVIKTPKHDLNLFNIHGIWDLDGDNFSPARRAMSAAIINAIRNKEHVILAGDTNARPTNKAIKNIEPYLKNVFHEDVRSTFNLARKNHPGYASSVVDMMFTDHSTQVISKECPEVDISDHLPLVATLQF